MVFWHSPQLKQGDSCFDHYCTGSYLAILQCLTQCPQARLYCSRMPYGAVLYCLCWLYLQAFLQNIYACIGVPVMHCMTGWTLPYTDRQIFYQWILIPTTGTGLIARIHGWYFDHIIPIPYICLRIRLHRSKSLSVAHYVWECQRQIRPN